MVDLHVYKPEYLPILKEILETQKHHEILLEHLPRHGYVAVVLGQPVAAGFLRLVEGRMAQIDSLMTNATLPGETRNTALVKLIDQLMSDAKDMGLIGVYAHTKAKDIIKRAKSLGFRIVKQTIIAKLVGE